MASDSMIGLVLAGKYQIVERIGAGGMGSVYKALQKPFDRQVAVKVLSPGLSEDQDLVRRFENEALIISKLHRPHTLTPIDFGQSDDGRMFLVTELLFGEPLNKILKRGPIGPERTAIMLEQVSGSLDEAHEKGIVHRDLKPANLFVEQVGGKDYFRVLDFGISKLQEGPSLTGANAFIGTPAYVSPEQARGEAVDHLSDIYCLGVIAYECLAGKPPFTSTNHMGVLYKQIHDPPPPLEGVPEELDLLVQRMLEKLPDRRPQSASEIVDLLHRMDPPSKSSLKVSPVEAAMTPIEVAPPTQPPTMLPPAPTTSRLPGIALALVASIVALGAFLFLREPEEISVQVISDAPKTSMAPVETKPVETKPVEKVVPAEKAPPVERKSPPRRRAPRKAAARRPNKPEPPPVEAPATAKLTVEVLTTGGRPLRASVWIDGTKLEGTAPITLPVEQGRHTVKIEAPGYAPKERVVELKSDRSVRFIADL